MRYQIRRKQDEIVLIPRWKCMKRKESNDYKMNSIISGACTEEEASGTVWLVFDGCDDSTYRNITPSFLHYFTLWSRLTSSDALNTRNFPIFHCHLVTPRSTLTSADLHLRIEACPSWKHVALNEVVIFVSDSTESRNKLCSTTIRFEKVMTCKTCRSR